MTEKRFTIEKSENQDTIFDWEGIDDYYHLGNDTRDVKGICKLLNDLNDENERLKKELNAFKPVMFQDMRKGTVILYQKGDVE